MHFNELSQKWGIAITGGIASGKSTIAESLRQRAFVVIDADQASRLVVLPGTEGFKEVVTYFGRDILTPSGEMDRAKMRDMIFQSPEKRIALEQIIHHRLAAVSEELLQRANLFQKPRIWFYEASLIYERRRAGDFSQVWVAYCPRETQIERVMARDHISRGAAEKILEAQMPAEEKVKQANYVIHTDCDRKELELRIDQALESLTSAPHLRKGE